MVLRVGGHRQRVGLRLRVDDRPGGRIGMANWTPEGFIGRLFKLIGEAVPAASAAMKWLKSAAQVISRLDLPLWWTTPAGRCCSRTGPVIPLS